jgi:hypothetical protein
MPFPAKIEKRGPTGMGTSVGGGLGCQRRGGLLSFTLALAAGVVAWLLALALAVGAFFLLSRLQPMLRASPRTSVM